MKFGLTISRVSLLFTIALCVQGCLGRDGGPEAGILEAEAKALFDLGNDTEEAIHDGFLAGSFSGTFNCSTGNVSQQASGSSNFSWDGTATPHDCVGTVGATGRRYRLTAGQLTLHTTGSSSTNSTTTITGTLTTNSEISGDCSVNYTITRNGSRSFAGTVCGYNVSGF